MGEKHGAAGAVGKSRLWRARRGARACAAAAARSGVVAERLEGRELLTATVVGRYVFYGNSAFDGASVSAAIAPDKAPLLPGQPASFANYTSYSKGVNGIAIDAVNWPLSPTAADFTLRAGNTTDPSTWAAVAQPASVSIARGAGTGGSDRVILRLPDGAVVNKWLQVTVNANADTGLSSPDVFYFGNAVGDGLPDAANAVVGPTDESGVRSDVHAYPNLPTVTDPFDFNRDRRVDAVDQLIARYSANTAATALPYFTPPAPANPGTSGAFAGVYNVKSYGALGNGSADDAAAIQAAADALKAAGQGLLYFPSGTYRIGRFLDLQGMSNFEIRGFGATVKPTNTDNVTDIGGDILRLRSCSNFTIGGVTFDGNAAVRGHNTNPTSLRIQGCSGFRVTGCTFADPVGDAIYLAAATPADDATATHDGLIEGCSFTSAYRNAISFIHGSRVLIQGNLIQNVAGSAPESGIDIEADPIDSEGANHDVGVVGNRFLNCATHGVSIIKTRTPAGVVVDGNSFVNCPTAVFNEGINTQVAGNVFHDTVNPPTGASHAAAQVYSVSVNGQTVQVTGNVFYNLTNVSAVLTDQTWTGRAVIANNRMNSLTGGGYGPIAVWSDNASITGNWAQNVPTVALNIMASNASVESNVLTGGVGDAIYCQGAGQTIRNNVVSGFPTAIDVRDPAVGGGAGSALTLVDANTVTNCPTGVMDVATNSRVVNNSFAGAAKPATGPGSGAMAQVYLLGATAATAQVTGNAFDSLTELAAVYVQRSWTGAVTISGNTVSNLAGVNYNAVNVLTDNAAVVGNTFQNVSSVAVNAVGNAIGVQGNVIAAGAGAGIIMQGAGGLLRSNNVTGRQYGIYLGGAGAGAAYTTVDANTITNCPTGVLVGVADAYVTNNAFGGASKPASGAGSDAQGQVYLVGAASGVAQVAGNRFDGLTNLSAVYVHGSWSGLATVSDNTVSNLGGSGYNAINVSADNTTVSHNTLTNVPVAGIAVAANNGRVEANTVPAGTFAGIYVEGNGNAVLTNSVTGRQYGIFLATPASPVVAAVTTVSGNTVVNCATGVFDAVPTSQVTNNSFGPAARPATGPGSDAVGQVSLAGGGGGSAQVAGNTFDSVTGMSAVYVTGSWVGQATLSNNRISNFFGTNYNAISIFANGATVTSNTLSNISTLGICVFANSADVENNSLTNGASVGIYAEGGNHVIKNNTLVDYGAPLNGLCIATSNGTGNDVIVGNTVRKTVPNPAWIPIQINVLDKPGVNFRYGVAGVDGAFIPGQPLAVAAPATSAGTSATPSLAPTSTSTPSSTPNGRVSWRQRFGARPR